MEGPQNLEELKSQKLQENTGLIIFVAICMFFGIIGNIATFVFFGFHGKREGAVRASQAELVTNFLICALALNDLITCVVFVDIILEHVYFVTFTNTALCKLYSTVNRVLVCNSILILLLIGVERFWQICFAMRKGHQLTRQLAGKCLVGIVIFDILTSAPDLYTYQSTQHSYELQNNITVNVYFCMVSTETHRKRFDDVMSWFDQIMLVIVFLALIVMYAVIIRQIAKMRQRMSRHVSLGASETSHNSPSEDTNVSNITETPANSAESLCRNQPGSSSPQELSNLGSNNHLALHGSTFDGVHDSPHDTQHHGYHSQSYSLSESNTPTTNTNNIPCTPPTSPTTQKHRKQKTEPSEVERRLAVMTCIVTLVSILSFVPHFVADLYINKNTILDVSPWTRTAYVSYVLNNSLNPYVIGLFNSQFRKFFLDKLRCVSQKK